MEIIRTKILLEDSIDRGYNSPRYGQLTATSFFINVILTQTIDDMGLFTDIEYLKNLEGQNTPVDYTVLIQKLQDSGITFPFVNGILPSGYQMQQDYETRVTGTQVSDYFYYTDRIVSGETESVIQDTRSYNSTQPYILNFDLSDETYINYSGGTIAGVDRVTNIGNPITYVFNTDKNDPNIGTINQKSGLLYNDYSGGTSTVSYIGEGWNATNINLSAITKEEYLFGIIYRPEVKNDVFIDRLITTIFENHLKLSEITNLDELSRYGTGYYKLIKQ